MDLVGPLPETKSGNKYIIVLADHLTKWPEAKGIPNKEAETVAKFVYSIICRFGAIETILTDQGREFCNHLNEILYRQFDIKHSVSSPYHPQTNGEIERLNQTIKISLLKYTDSQQGNWDEHLESILFAYRTAIHKSTKFSPFFLLYGSNPRLPSDLDFNPLFSKESDSNEAQLLENRIEKLEELEAVRSLARARYTSSKLKDKEYKDSIQTLPDFKKGDLVLMENKRKKVSHS